MNTFLSKSGGDEQQTNKSSIIQTQPALSSNPQTITKQTDF
jgi:hypothetical protein